MATSYTLDTRWLNLDGSWGRATWPINYGGNYDASVLLPAAPTGYRWVLYPGGYPGWGSAPASSASVTDACISVPGGNTTNPPTMLVAYKLEPVQYELFVHRIDSAGALIDYASIILGGGQAYSAKDLLPVPPWYYGWQPMAAYAGWTCSPESGIASDATVSLPYGPSQNPPALLVAYMLVKDPKNTPPPLLCSVLPGYSKTRASRCLL